MLLNDEDIKTISIIKINPFEIANAEDIDIGFKSLISNLGLMLHLFTQVKNDFIIGGNIEVVPNKLKLKIAPYIAYSAKTKMFYCTAKDTFIDLKASNKMFDRIDVICIGGEGWVEFKKEKRAKWYVASSKGGNDGIIFDEFNKRQKQKVELFCIEGDVNNEKANSVKDGLIKIAEVKVKASRTLLGKEDVYFVSALLDGDKTETWTNENSRTFYVSPLKDSLNRYFKIHKSDGFLKKGVITADILDLTSGNGLTGAKIGIGGDIVLRAGIEKTGTFIYKTPFESEEKLEVQIFSQTNIKKTFDIVFEKILHVWSSLIDGAYNIYLTSKKHTDTSLKEERKEIDFQIKLEKKERIKALDKERAERIETIKALDEKQTEALTNEEKERIKADEKERDERVKAIEQEIKDREKTIEKEMIERSQEDAKTKTLIEETKKTCQPVGSIILNYNLNKDIKGYLHLNGESFESEKYPELYAFWLEHLSYLGKDENQKPLLPLIQAFDDSTLGSLTTFIGKEYHDEFLLCDGKPFSPQVYKTFYNTYWKKYLSHLGKDKLTGWPLRPRLESTIKGTNIYIKVLPKILNEGTQFFIRTGA